MVSKLLYAQTVGLYGCWLAETRSENPNTIMEKYLDKVHYLNFLFWIMIGQQSLFCSLMIALISVR